MTDEEKALLWAVCREPEDDTVRLAYADWLEENAGIVECDSCKRPEDAKNHVTGHVFVGWGHGWQPCTYCGATGRVPDHRAKHAEFIRVQCRIAELNAAADEYRNGSERVTIPRTKEQCREWKQVVGSIKPLRRREKELWNFGAPGTWVDAIKPAFDCLQCIDKETIAAQQERPTDTLLVYRRGFVDEVRLSAAALLGGPCGNCQYWAWDSSRPIEQSHAHCESCHGKKTTPGLARAIFSAHPITTVVLTSVPDMLAIGVVRETTEYDPQRRAEVTKAAWTVGGPGLEQKQMGLQHAISDREMLSVLRDREVARHYFDREIDAARRPESVLKAWWPKVTFRIEPRQVTLAPGIDLSFLNDDYVPTPNVGNS